MTDPKLIHNTEQAMAGTRAFAATIAAFYRELLPTMDAGSALRLTCTYVNALASSRPNADQS